MNLMTVQYNKCKKFLIDNDFHCSMDGELRCYDKTGYLGYDFNLDGNEITVIGEVGDIDRFPISFYALVGYMIITRQIDVGVLNCIYI